MAVDQMPTQLVAQLERQFEIDALTLLPVAEMGLVERLARGFDREPVGSLLDHRQAAARAGDRGAHRHRRNGVLGPDDEAPVALLAARREGRDLADVGDDPREHVVPYAARCQVSTTSPASCRAETR